MIAARGAGVPVPEVVAWSDTDEELGPWIVMEEVAGESLARRIQRDDAYNPVRERFATECGAALARIHGIEPSAVAGAEEGGDPLQGVRARLDALAAPNATIEWALRHLEESRPSLRSDRLVHGDFRLGNLIVGPDHVRAVLDWEGVHLGDPLEDLGWLCSKTWRFGGPLPVGGFGTREELCGAYGHGVTPGDLWWWEVLASVRWGVICLEQASRHFHGYRSVELAAIGRRLAEVEWDLLGLLP